MNKKFEKLWNWKNKQFSQALKLYDDYSKTQLKEMIDTYNVGRAIGKMELLNELSTVLRENGYDE